LKGKGLPFTGFDKIQKFLKNSWIYSCKLCKENHALMGRTAKINNIPNIFQVKIYGIIAAIIVKT
jgi:hypothetical protein